ncbi:hypothetical protein ABEB36_009085 [Hypothenemus hampei]|uniref:SCP domain-containing protein n=1 Tax=Hypothenemus hampei TaxID=57062 RepID=A0ABD1EP32_HYPHA
MKFPFLIIFVELIFNGSNSVLIKDVDWCNSPNCKLKMNHTICKWGVLCPPDKLCETTLEFNKEMKDYIMELHNIKRNKIALGEDDNVPIDVRKAANMNVLQWHIHLEFVARCHSRQCTFGHDECRVVPDFPKVGQNIFFKSFPNYKAHDVNIKEIVENSIQAWYGEVKHVPEEVYEKFKNTVEAITEHYTQMIWADTTHIGCGLSQTKNQKDLKFYLVCNYGLAGNVVTWPIYKVGEPCSKCSTGKECNTKFKGLCGNIEDYAIKCPCEEA